MNTDKLDHFTVDELVDANTHCRRVVGKPLEDCDHNDLERVHASLRVEAQFLTIVRDQAAHELQQIATRARQRRAERHRAARDHPAGGPSQPETGGA